MRLRLWAVLVGPLILLSAACGGGGPAWIPHCQVLPAEEAEHIITANGRRLVEGEVEGTTALRAEDTHNGRAIWAVILKVGDTKLVLLHDTAPSVESPGDAGWRDGRWLSHDAATAQALGFPLNGSQTDPYPASVVEVAERCGLSVMPY
jgi:hypothetical protein